MWEISLFEYKEGNLLDNWQVKGSRGHGYDWCHGFACTRVFLQDKLLFLESQHSEEPCYRVPTYSTVLDIPYDSVWPQYKTPKTL